MSNQENNKNDDYITIDQYLNEAQQTKMKQIQFYDYRGNNDNTELDKAVLLIGQDYISYTEYSGNDPRISPVVLNSKDCLIRTNRDNKTISIKLQQQNQENSDPVLTFAYVKNEILFDTGSANKKVDNSNTTTTMEYGGEGGTPGMQEK
jgi:hypothetical protein